MADSGTNTTPVIISTPKPQTMTTQMQTEPMINELIAIPDEPEPMFSANEPEIAHINAETGSNSSLLDVPVCEEVLEIVLPPPQEPETEEDPYVDDWADSELYKYVYELHYEKMVKKKLISVELIKRPTVPKEQEGMNQNQRYD